ncbi:hypothetical protein [Micromonospora sp. NPDC048830]|uniref:hypothetical protein n=1 Tax=Micromonospora sp. NPDC048830 TaxID=3364257 RepID=UPI0037126036
MLDRKRVPRRAVLTVGLAVAATAATAAFPADPAMAWVLHPAQAGWHFYNRCFAMVRLDGVRNNACPAGGGHVEQGWTFQLPYTTSSVRHAGETADQQSAWVQCSDCSGLYYLDFPGVCPAGGFVGHGFSGTFLQYLMPHDIVPQPPNTQSPWRFCRLCSAMYYQGYYPNEGRCAARPGLGHDAAGHVFQVPVYSY